MLNAKFFKFFVENAIMGPSTNKGKQTQTSIEFTSQTILLHKK